MDIGLARDSRLVWEEACENLIAHEETVLCEPNCAAGTVQ